MNGIELISGCHRINNQSNCKSNLFRHLGTRMCGKESRRGSMSPLLDVCSIFTTVTCAIEVFTHVHGCFLSATEPIFTQLDGG